MNNTSEAKSKTQATASHKSADDKDPALQGEGNRTADRRYRQSAKEFLESGNVAPVAEAAAPENEAQRREMQAAEEVGKSHARK